MLSYSERLAGCISLQSVVMCVRVTISFGDIRPCNEVSSKVDLAPGHPEGLWS